jgi:hypothetical protein
MWTAARLRTLRVMPAPRSSARGQAPAGIHDFLCCNKVKSWMPAFAGMTIRAAPRVRPDKAGIHREMQQCLTA